MKIFKGKTFFIRSILLHVFLVIVIAFVSINFWENPVYDAIINSSSATVEGSKDISLIVIDNKSLDSYRWPWARSLYGEIFEYLNKYTNAKVVIFDSVLHQIADGKRKLHLIHICGYRSERIQDQVNPSLICNRTETLQNILQQLIDIHITDIHICCFFVHFYRNRFFHLAAKYIARNKSFSS